MNSLIAPFSFFSALIPNNTLPNTNSGLRVSNKLVYSIHLPICLLFFVIHVSVTVSALTQTVLIPP